MSFENPYNFDSRTSPGEQENNPVPLLKETWFKDIKLISGNENPSLPVVPKSDGEIIEEIKEGREIQTYTTQIKKESPVKKAIRETYSHTPKKGFPKATEREIGIPQTDQPVQKEKVITKIKSIIKNIGNYTKERIGEITRFLKNRYTLMILGVGSISALLSILLGGCTPTDAEINQASSNTRDNNGSTPTEEYIPPTITPTIMPTATPIPSSSEEPYHICNTDESDSNFFFHTDAHQNPIIEEITINEKFLEEIITSKIEFLGEFKEGYYNYLIITDDEPLIETEKEMLSYLEIAHKITENLPINFVFLKKRVFLDLEEMKTDSGYTRYLVTNEGEQQIATLIKYIYTKENYSYNDVIFIKSTEGKNVGGVSGKVPTTSISMHNPGIILTHESLHGIGGITYHNGKRITIPMTGLSDKYNPPPQSINRNTLMETHRTTYVLTDNEGNPIPELNNPDILLLIERYRIPITDYGEHCNGYRLGRIGYQGPSIMSPRIRDDNNSHTPSAYDIINKNVQGLTKWDTIYLNQLMKYIKITQEFTDSQTKLISWYEFLTISQ